MTMCHLNLDKYEHQVLKRDNVGALEQRQQKAKLS